MLKISLISLLIFISANSFAGQYLMDVRNETNEKIHLEIPTDNDLRNVLNEVQSNKNLVIERLNLLQGNPVTQDAVKRGGGEGGDD
jgi:SepF-like predicted cell division protein (DUF552 family)